VTSRHSFGNVLRGAAGMLRRRRALLADTATLPPQPSRGLVENYLPVDPDEWHAYARAGFDLFGSFQTRSARDEGEAAITRGERDEHPVPAPAEPVNRLLQTIDLDPVRVALLDTRTRRTRRERHPVYSQFVDPDVLDEVIELASRAPIFVLVLAQPVLKPAAWLTDRRRPERVRPWSDHGMEHYWHQYRRFWSRLLAARNGRPTITIGGDIHRSHVGFASDLAHVEIIASPMSHVCQGRLAERGARLRAGARRLLGRQAPEDGERIVRVADLLAGPDDAPGGAPAGPEGPADPGDQRAAVYLARLPAAQESFATLALTRTGPAAVRLDVQLHDRRELATAPDPVPPAAQVSFLLDAASDTGRPAVAVASASTP